jgi:hypothetical protein
MRTVVTGVDPLLGKTYNCYVFKQSERLRVLQQKDGNQRGAI